MAYRRKHGPQRSLTFIEDFRSSSSFAADDSESPSISSLPSPQLAAHAIRASAAHRDSSSLSSAYGEPSAHRNPKHLTRSATYATPKDSVTYEYTSMKSLNEAKYGFWGVLARKAKSILEDDNTSPPFQLDENSRSRFQMPDTSAGDQFNQSYTSPDRYQKSENPSLNRGSEFASSLHQIGGTIKSALEEGLTIVENRTAGIIEETRKLQIRRKSGSFSVRSQPADHLSASSYLYPNLNDRETQLKASRDVANAMAAKAKLLLRELKTVKADLTFAKERCAQLEEENKLLRESRDKGDSIEDDDLIRLQLETLLEEKGRLAHDNSIYARENRFLREIVDYHQLTMQDVVYVDEGIDEVTEVCPIQLPPHLSHSSPGRLSPIISRPGSSNNSNTSSPRFLDVGEPGSANNSTNSSPRFLNVRGGPEIFLAAASTSPSSPSSPINLLVPSPPRNLHAEAQDGSLPSSPKPAGLRRQRSLTP